MRSKGERTKARKAQGLVPKLRFPGFERDWNMAPLEKHLDYLQPTPYLVGSEEYKDEYETPVLTAGKTFVLGYSDETTGIYKEELPVIIFDDFTTATKYVDFPFKVKSSALKILTPHKNSNVKFFYEAMQLIDYEVSAHGRQWISAYAKIEVPVPVGTEQVKIANCLAAVDANIAAETRKLDALKAHKNGLMQQLFPVEGQRVPRLRFPGFAGEWRAKALDDIITIVTPPAKLQTSQYMSEGLYPIIDQSPQPVAGWTDDKASLVAGPFPLIVFGDHTCTLKCANKPFAQGADGIKIFRAKGGVSTEFLFQCLQVKPVTMLDYRRHFSQLKEKTVAFPKDSREQSRIADLLSNLDELIRSEGGKIEFLKEHKKGLMQGLFPAIDAIDAIDASAA